MLYSTSAARVRAVLRGGCSKGVSARAMPDPIETIRACLASPLPPGYRNPGPRVEHLLAPREDFVSTLVAEGLQLPQDVVAGLIEIGAVYCCPVPPALPGSLACEPSSGARQAALKQHGNDTRLSTPRRASRTSVAPAGAYLRVHAHVKRFPAADCADWAARLLAVTDEHVIVNKPCGVPVPITVDNARESVVTQASQAFQAAQVQQGLCPASPCAPPTDPQPLHIIHRLDRCTEGVVVLGRGVQAVRAFHDAQHSGRVQKTYRLLCHGSQPPPLGLLTHHLAVGTRIPGCPIHSVAHDEPRPGTAACSLMIESAESAPALESVHGGPVIDCVVRLVTGRTHQIRAQMAAVGHPLVGDTLYGPLARRPGQAPVEVAMGDLQEPELAIGLQAARMVVMAEDGATVLHDWRAPEPWWTQASSCGPQHLASSLQ
uniref:Pseudouridine synthase RsuA/RluA-like domain-containing protein n=1 Tax=Auxenochlorella protothecoides TaxID=3075 RepID=A0A1D2A7T3_AUXPR